MSPLGGSVGTSLNPASSGTGVASAAGATASGGQNEVLANFFQSLLAGEHWQRLGLRQANEQWALIKVFPVTIICSSLNWDERRFIAGHGRVKRC